MKKVKIFDKYIQHNKKVNPEYNTPLDEKINAWAKAKNCEIISISCAVNDSSLQLYQFAMVIYEDKEEL